MVGHCVEFTHEGADGVLLKLGEVAGPVVFIAQSPEDDAGMMAVLVDHGSQHVAGLLAVALSAESATAPGNLFPHEQSQ